MAERRVDSMVGKKDQLIYLAFRSVVMLATVTKMDSLMVGYLARLILTVSLRAAHSAELMAAMWAKWKSKGALMDVHLAGSMAEKKELH